MPRWNLFKSTAPNWGSLLLIRLAPVRLEFVMRHKQISQLTELSRLSHKFVLLCSQHSDNNSNNNNNRSSISCHAVNMVRQKRRRKIKSRSLPRPTYPASCLVVQSAGHINGTRHIFNRKSAANVAAGDFIANTWGCENNCKQFVLHTWPKMSKAFANTHILECVCVRVYMQISMFGTYTHRDPWQSLWALCAVYPRSHPLPPRTAICRNRADYRSYRQCQCVWILWLYKWAKKREKKRDRERKTGIVFS